MYSVHMCGVYGDVVCTYMPSSFHLLYMYINHLINHHHQSTLPPTHTQAGALSVEEMDSVIFMAKYVAP